MTPVNGSKRCSGQPQMLACPPVPPVRRKSRTRSLRLHVAYDIDRVTAVVPAVAPSTDTLVELALASGDEDAIKLTEAALRTFAPSSDEAVLAAAADAPPASESGGAAGRSVRPLATL